MGVTVFGTHTRTHTPSINARSTTCMDTRSLTHSLSSSTVCQAEWLVCELEMVSGAVVWWVLCCSEAYYWTQRHPLDSLGEGSRGVGDME